MEITGETLRDTKSFVKCDTYTAQCIIYTVHNADVLCVG